MKKLNLNKKTVAQMDRIEMGSVNGGICIASCPRGSRKGKKCCGENTVADPGDATIITFGTVQH